MRTKGKNNTLPRSTTLILTAFFTTFLCSPSHSQELVLVDGVTPVCVVVGPRGSPNPGPAIPFSSPRYGYCNGSIQQRCATSVNGALPGSVSFRAVGTACVGTFTSWAELQAQQAKNISDQLQQQVNLLKNNIKALSDANDALTKRLDDVESQLKKLGQPK
jgi:hypothetical protein